MNDEPTPIEHRLSGDELDTIIAVANNEQTGRLTRWEIETLVEAYLDLKFLKREHADLQRDYARLRTDYMKVEEELSWFKSKALADEVGEPMYPMVEISAPNLQAETAFEFAKRLRAELRSVISDPEKIYDIEMDIMRHANHPQRLLDTVKAYVWVR